MAASPILPTYVPDIDDTQADASTSNRDPFKFSHGLTGVDQQSNYLFVHILIATAVAPAVLTLGFRVFNTLWNRNRRTFMATTLSRHEAWQNRNHKYWGLFQQQFLYAPVRSIQADKHRSNTANLGTTTRPQLAVIVIYVVTNVAYCMTIPAQPRIQKVAEFRGRCGTLAAFNLVFTVLFALRNNPFIWILCISYDTFNLFHRWVARLVIFEVVAHVLAFMFNAYQVSYAGKGGFHSIFWILQHCLSYRWGLSAFCAFGLLMVQSTRPLRQAFYTCFLILHRISVLVAISGLYFHLAKHTLPQLPWIYLIATLLAVESLIRVTRILFYNLSYKRRTWTRVSLEALSGEATRVTFWLPRSWNANPGSHVHIYLPRVALWSSHPFSVAWSYSSSHSNLSPKRLPLTSTDLLVQEGSSSISCVVRARTGMTRALYQRASEANGRDVFLWGAIEGPYGGHHSLTSYETAVLFAAGVGITYQLSFVQHLLSGQAATQKILLVWSIAHTDVIEWVQAWFEEIATMQNFSAMVRIRLHVSKMTSLEFREQRLPTFLDVRLQRCNPQNILDEEIVTQTGAMVVSVCGPSGFNDGVRAAVRRRVCIRSIDFMEEVFSY